MGIISSKQPAPIAHGPEYEKNVMFLCNHNSCRSQMADAYFREIRGESSIGCASAGIVGGTSVKAGAVTVMKEVGIDISNYSSDDVADFDAADFDVVISCCGRGPVSGGPASSPGPRASTRAYGVASMSALKPPRAARPAH